MATHTLGTTSTTSLTAITFNKSPNVLLPADLAAIVAAILTDPQGGLVQGPQTAAEIGYAGFSYNGLLLLPNSRGVVKVHPGDVIAVDESSGVGWPILVSANAIANGAWHYV